MFLFHQLLKRIKNANQLLLNSFWILLSFLHCLPQGNLHFYHLGLNILLLGLWHGHLFQLVQSQPLLALFHPLRLCRLLSPPVPPTGHVQFLVPIVSYMPMVQFLPFHSVAVSYPPFYVPVVPPFLPAAVSSLPTCSQSVVACTLPTHSEPEPARTSPVHSEPEPARTSPVHSEPEPARTSPVHSEPEPARTSPVHSEPEPARTSPVHSEPEPARTSPVHSEPEPARTSPVHSEPEPARTSPVHSEPGAPRISPAQCRPACASNKLGKARITKISKNIFSKCDKNIYENVICSIPTTNKFAVLLDDCKEENRTDIVLALNLKKINITGGGAQNFSYSKTCDYCGKTYMSKSLFSKHLRKYKCVERVKSTYPKKCEVCLKFYSSRSSFANHLKCCKPKICDVLPKSNCNNLLEASVSSQAEIVKKPKLCLVPVKTTLDNQHLTDKCENSPSCV
ncbi:uncharacterized protein LOC129968157 [Argiope bruennichi]|uniref:uncharacterized protein LOC129968157 n=1 Tax=Argiope bruennichi TaxID=94029 RepID=UPI002494191D|nr:uncharacterized protein LOC129968157 [Argiope bruennichi]